RHGQGQPPARRAAAREPGRRATGDAPIRRRRASRRLHLHAGGGQKMMPRALKAIRWTLLAGSALLGASLHAQPYETPPKPVEPRPLTISPPTEHSLPNGMRVVVAERRGVPLVTTRLVLLTGSEADPERRAGLASMTA